MSGFAEKNETLARPYRTMDRCFFLGKNFRVKLGKTWDFCLFGWLSEA